MRSATIVLLAAIVWNILPFWLQRGMFMDGVIYAAVAQNLAEGVGSFWAPVYQPSALEPYSEQLPMFTGMESVLFQLMGDTHWVERVFMGLAWIASACGLIVLQRQWWPEKARGSWLWTLGVWSAAPLVGWGMGNHVQEMWMAPFAIWAVASMSNTKWVWLGGLLTILAALFKGPQGLFPLAWIPLLWIVGLLDRKTALFRFCTVLAVAAVALVGIWLWDDAREAIVRNAANRLVRTFTQERAVTTGQRFWLLGPLLGQWAAMAVVALLISWAQNKSIRLHVRKNVLAMFGIALCASLPLMVTHEQRDFYLIPSLSFAALGFANLGQKGLSQPDYRTNLALGGLVAVGVVLLPFRIVERDAALRSSLEQYQDVFVPRTSFNTTSDLRLNHELAAYAMRYYRWEVDLANLHKHHAVIRRDSLTGGVVLKLKNSN